MQAFDKLGPTEGWIIVRNHVYTPRIYGAFP